MRLGHGTGGSLLNGSLKDQQMNQSRINQPFDWWYFYRGFGNIEGSRCGKSSCLLVSKRQLTTPNSYRQKQQSFSAVVINMVKKLVLLTEFPSFNGSFFRNDSEGGNHPLLISSTVIVPIIHVKNKAGVCSSILKIKMKNENCHKTEISWKRKQHFWVVWVPSEYQSTSLSTIWVPSGLGLLQVQQWLVGDS